MKKALIVVDMLNDFVRADGALYVGPSVRAIVPRVQACIERCRREEGVVIFVADYHRPDDPEFDMWPPHCVAGTDGAELIPDLERKASDYFVRKTSFSAFYGTELDAILSEEGIGEVAVVGVCTSICVMYTVADLRSRGFPVTVPRDAVADLTPESQTFALNHMQKVLGARVTSRAFPN